MKTSFNKTNPKRILGYLMAFAMVLFSANAFSQCDHTLNMYDAFGDGWNGNAVDVTVNGAVVVAGATITAAQGSANSETFSASSGDIVDLSNWVTGSWTSEVSWDITDGDGTVIASGVHGGSGASVGNCPSVIAGCMDPTASNYNSSATVDDGSCVWITPPSCCNTAQYGAGAAPLY